MDSQKNRSSSSAGIGVFLLLSDETKEPVAGRWVPKY